MKGDREGGRELFESRKESQQRPTTIIAIMLHAPVNKTVKKPSFSFEGGGHSRTRLYMSLWRREVLVVYWSLVMFKYTRSPL